MWLSWSERVNDEDVVSQAKIHRKRCGAIAGTMKKPFCRLTEGFSNAVNAVCNVRSVVLIGHFAHKLDTHEAQLFFGVIAIEFMVSGLEIIGLGF